MPGNNPAQRAAETCEEPEIFLAHSMNYSVKAANIFFDAIGQLKVVLDTLTMLIVGHDQSRVKASLRDLRRIIWPAIKGKTCHAGIFSRRLGPLMS